MDEMTDEHLWASAVSLYGIGDIATTSMGTNVDGIVEKNPISEKILGSYGLAGMVSTKVISLLLLYKLYEVSPSEWRSGVPLGLTVVGSGIVASNSTTIVKAVNKNNA